MLSWLRRAWINCDGVVFVVDYDGDDNVFC